MNRQATMTAESARQEVYKMIQQGFTLTQIIFHIGVKFAEIYFQKDDELLADVTEFCNSFGPFKSIQYLQDKKILKIDGDTFAYDPITHTKTRFNLEDYRGIVNPKFLVERTIPCFSTFRPKSSADFIEENGKLFFNVYEPPAWKRDFHFNNTPIPKATLPVEYQNFYGHFLAGHAPSMDHNYKWMANMIHGNKNLTYNVFVGEEGAGKGVNAKICAALVGMQYHTSKSGKEFLESRFSGYLKNMLLFSIEEASIINAGDDDKYKDLVNDKIAIEAKGKESEYTENQLQIIMNSNNYLCLRLKQSQRRYNIYEISKANLRTNMFFQTDESIKKLYTDENLVAQLAQYLWHLQYDEKDLAFPFVASENYKRMLNSGLTDWENHMLTQVCRKYAGQTLFTQHVSSIISYETDNKSFRPSHSKFVDLQKRYPGFFKATRFKSTMKNDITIPPDFKDKTDYGDVSFSQVIKFDELADMQFDKFFLIED